MTDRQNNQSADEQTAFAQLQSTLPALFEKIVPDRTAPRTIVVVPSLSVDQDVVAGIAGLHHYEERMLGMLMLLRLPRTRLIYVTSQPIPETIIDYYLHLLQGVPAQHARARLTMLACFDSSARPLSEKILARPRLLAGYVTRSLTRPAPTSPPIPCLNRNGPWPCAWGSRSMAVIRRCRPLAPKAAAGSLCGRPA